MRTAPAAHLVTLLPNIRPLYLNINSCRGPAVEYICPEFGVDSSSRFPFRVRTHTHADEVTDDTDHPTNASAWLNN